MSKFFTLNFDFIGHISTFRAENTPKSSPFKAENNAQTTPEQLPNNFEKVQKTTFLTPKKVKMTPKNRQNEQIVVPKFRFDGSYINLSSRQYTK